jgi:hypothetical protein
MSKQTSKYKVGNVFYLPQVKQHVMVAAPTEAGTVAHLVSEKNVDYQFRYNIRTNKVIQ